MVPFSLLWNPEHFPVYNRFSNICWMNEWMSWVNLDKIFLKVSVVVLHSLIICSTCFNAFKNFGCSIKMDCTVLKIFKSIYLFMWIHVLFTWLRMWIGIRKFVPHSMYSLVKLLAFTYHVPSSHRVFIPVTDDDKYGLYSA